MTATTRLPLFGLALILGLSPVSTWAQSIDPDAIDLSPRTLEMIVDLSQLSDQAREDVLVAWGPMRAEFQAARRMRDAIDSFQFVLHPLCPLQALDVDGHLDQGALDIAETAARVRRVRALLGIISTRGHGDREQLLDVWQGQIIDALLPCRTVMSIPGDDADIDDLLRLARAAKDEDQDAEAGATVRRWRQRVFPLLVDTIRWHHEYRRLRSEWRAGARDEPIAGARVRRNLERTLLRLGTVRAEIYDASNDAAAELESVLTGSELGRFRQLHAWAALSPISDVDVAEVALALSGEEAADDRVLLDTADSIAREAPRIRELIRAMATADSIEETAGSLAAILCGEAESWGSRATDAYVEGTAEFYETLRTAHHRSRFDAVPVAERSGASFGGRVNGAAIPCVDDLAELDLEPSALASITERVDLMQDEVQRALDVLAQNADTSGTGPFQNDPRSLREQWIARRRLESTCIDEILSLVPTDETALELQWTINRRRTSRALAEIYGQSAGFRAPEFVFDPFDLLDDLGLREGLDASALAETDARFLRTIDDTVALTFELYATYLDVWKAHNEQPSLENQEAMRLAGERFDRQRNEAIQLAVNSPDIVARVLAPEDAAAYREGVNGIRYPWATTPTLIETVREHPFGSAIEDEADRAAVTDMIDSYCAQLSHARDQVRDALIEYSRTGFLRPNPVMNPDPEWIEIIEHGWKQYIRQTLEAARLIGQHILAAESEEIPLDLALFVRISVTRQDALDDLLEALDQPPELR